MNKKRETGAEFMKRKNIEISAKRYFIDAMSAMAQGLFCTLLIGTSYGRENGDNIHRRVSAQVRGEQGTEGAGRNRKYETGVSGEGRTEGDAGQDVLREDSEGRRLTKKESPTA